MKKRRILYLLMSAALVIPSYPGSKKMWEKKMTTSGIDLTIIQYQSSDAASRILDFYSDELAKLGWVLKHRSDNPPFLYLTGKDLSNLSIKCLDVLNRGINDIVIAHSSPITQGMIDALVLDTDSPGEDIASIPRHPGSIRKFYNKSNQATTLIYEIKQGCFDCVLRFYRAEMPARGWELLKETKTDISKALQTKNLPEDLQKNLPKELSDLSALAGLEKYPLVAFSFKSKTASAEIGVSESEGTVVININFFSGS